MLHHHLGLIFTACIKLGQTEDDILREDKPLRSSVQEITYTQSVKSQMTEKD